MPNTKRNQLSELTSRPTRDALASTHAATDAQFSVRGRSRSFAFSSWRADQHLTHKKHERPHNRIDVRSRD